MSQSKETTLTLYIPHKHVLWSMKHTKKQKTMPKGKIIKGTDWSEYSYILWRMIYNTKAAVETESKTLT